MMRTSHGKVSTLNGISQVTLNFQPGQSCRITMQGRPTTV